jgi:hypothetical protein
LTNDFFSFLSNPPLFWRKNTIYIPHSSALKEEEEDHQEIKKGEIFHQWEKIRFECVCVFSLFCLGGKNIFFSNLFLSPFVHLLMVLLLTKCLFYKSIFSV